MYNEKSVFWGELVMNSERCHNPVIQILRGGFLSFTFFYARLKISDKEIPVISGKGICVNSMANTEKEDLEDTVKGKLKEIFTCVH